MPAAPATRYTRTAVVLHWTIAVLLLANLALGQGFGLLPDEAVRPAVDTHKSIGVTVLGLALLRLLWRLSHPAPPLPRGYPRWERAAAHAAHALLYALMIALPLSGWLHDSAWKDAATHPMRWFGLVPWPRIGFVQALEPGPKESLHALFGQVHAWIAYAVYALLALHVGAALKHQWIDREPELERMSLGDGAAGR